RACSGLTTSMMTPPANRSAWGRPVVSLVVLLSAITFPPAGPALRAWGHCTHSVPCGSGCASMRLWVCGGDHIHGAGGQCAGGVSRRPSGVGGPAPTLLLVACRRGFPGGRLRFRLLGGVVRHELLQLGEGRAAVEEFDRDLHTGAEVGCAVSQVEGGAGVDEDHVAPAAPLLAPQDAAGEFGVLADVAASEVGQLVPA